jgi:hypothetical protein
MESTRKLTISGAALAVAAAGLFLTAGVAPAVADDAKIHCTGVNGCKGKAECKTAKNDCKGQNACKGQGFSAMTKEKCDAAKGKYMPS